MKLLPLLLPLGLLVAACGPRVEPLPIAQVVPPPPVEQRIVVPPPAPLEGMAEPAARPRVHRHRSHKVRRTHEMLVRTQLARCPPGLRWQPAHRMPIGGGASRTAAGHCYRPS